MRIQSSRLLLPGALLGLSVCALAQAQDSGTWVPTATQGITLANFTTPAQSVGPLPDATPLHILVGLRLQNETQLDSTILAVNTPGTPRYGHFLTPAQFGAGYAPTSSQVQAVESYLASMGFTQISAPSNGLYVSAEGSAAAVEAAFNTTLWQYQISGPNGEPSRTVYANTQVAQVPATLGGIVLSVVGLENVDTVHTFLGTWPDAAPAPAVPAPSPPANPVTFTPQDFWKVYDVGAVPAASGSTIAIFAEGNLAGILPSAAEPGAPSDLRQFESENNLPQVPVDIVKVGLGSSDTSGAVEFDMDTQESTGMAGNVKQLIVYDSDSLNDVDLIPGFNDFVTQDLAQAGSASFGGCETLEYISGAMPLYDQIFREAAVQGQTVFASSGDSGSACGVVGDTNGVPLSGVPAAVEFPASDTYVMGAGGTTLYVDSSFNVTETTAWDAGGGGTSLWEYSGAWQSPFAPAGAAGKGVPDVAMDADFLLSPAGFVSGGSDTSNGGTSLASPLSLGSWARLEGTHDDSLGFAGPVLYALAKPGVPFSSITGMTDVTLGSNGIYQATPGWDYTTGLGSFDISEVSALVGQTGAGVGSGSPCVLPGVVVVQTPAGAQTGAPANAEDDITGVDIAETYDANPPAGSYPDLTFTIQVSNLSALPSLPANTEWEVKFVYDGQAYFVDMDTFAEGVVSGSTGGTPTNPEFEYGVTVGGTAGATSGTDVTLGAITGSYSTASNTITLVIPDDSIVQPQPGCSLSGCTPGTPGSSNPPPAAGSKLSSISGAVTQLVGAAGTGLLETVDSTPTGEYTLVGNASCNPAAPVTAILSATPTSGYAPLSVTLDASASHPPLNGGEINGYTFNFGDGSEAVTQSTPTVTHTYSSAGTYQADVTVSDTGGGTATSSNVTITVNAPAQSPTAALSASPSTGKTPLTVIFDASQSRDPNPNGSITQYTFNFADGSAPMTQSSPTATHVYTAAARYTASVTVTDSEDGTASTTVGLRVKQ